MDRLEKSPLFEDVVAVGMVTHTELSEEEVACINDWLVNSGRRSLRQPYQVLTYRKVEVNGIIVSSRATRTITRNDCTIRYKNSYSESTSYAIIQKLLTVRMEGCLDAHLALVYAVTTAPCQVLDEIDFPANLLKYANLVKSDFITAVSCSSTLLAIASKTIKFKYVDVNVALTSLVNESEVDC